MLPVPGRLLSDETSERVYQTKVRRLLFRNVQRAEAPRFIIVGGQPGCGKTGAVLSAARELKQAGSGVAIINGDELRPFHPDYARLVKQDRSTAADKTGPDVGAWVERGIREAAANGFNAVIETTMRQPAVVAATIGEFLRAGFQAEMHVLVVHPEVSRQAIYERFYRALGQRASLPRFTLASYHEAALERMPATLQAVEDLGVSVRLLDRQGVVLHDSRDASTKAIDVLTWLRTQPLKAADVDRLAKGWGDLRSQLDRAGVPDVVREGVRHEQQRFAQLHRRSRGQER